MRRCNSIAFQVASGVIIACAIVSTIVKARAAAPPAAVSWDGDCANQLWSQLCGVGNGTTNWSTDNLPTLADDVAIPMGAPVVRVIGQASAKTISCQSGLLINNSLQLANGGTIRNLTVNSLDDPALQIDAGQVVMTGASAWTGRVGGNGELANAGTMTGAIQITDSVDFVNDFTANLVGMAMDSGATAANSVGAAFNVAVAAPNGQSTIGGAGTFTKHGNFTTIHQSASTIDIACPFIQDTGSFDITGSTSGLGTRVIQDATFTGGTIRLFANSRLRFQDPGAVGAVFTFNGLSSITGDGNVYLEAAGTSDWRVESDLEVNLTGTDGLVLFGQNTTLLATLRNMGKARWTGGRLRQDDSCGFCVPEFRNEATLNIAANSVTLDTWLNNASSGQITHEFGGVLIGEAGLLMNGGTYRHLAGVIARSQPALQENGTFDNAGTYIRPNLARHAGC